MKIAVIWLAASFCGVLAACIQVEGDRILARDLAAAERQFEAIPADTPLGYAPAPGVRRVFSPGELTRVAARFHLTLDTPHEMCVERAAEQLSAARVHEAVAAAAPGIDIELIDFSRYRVPKGELSFALTGITAPPDPARPVVWKGSVRYADHHQFAVWARVRVSVTVQRVVALRPIPAGHAIELDAVRVETASVFPFGRQAAARLEEVAGRVPRRTLPAGAPVFTYVLDAPKEVNSGDRVMVEASSGQARVSFEGRAEAAGRQGDIIAVRNPATGRTLRASVESPGKVAVRLSPAPQGEK